MNVLHTQKSDLTTPVTMCSHHVQKISSFLTSRQLRVVFGTLLLNETLKIINYQIANQLKNTTQL